MSNGTSGPLDFGELVNFYEQVVDPLTLPIGLSALDFINIASGYTLIDAGAGTGALAMRAAERGARVLATDIEPKMVERAAERLRQHATSEARVEDFNSLQVPDASFDAAVSIVGVLAFEGGETGLRELVRVVRPGGRIAVATWDQEENKAPHYLASEVYRDLFPNRQLWPEGFFPSWTKVAVSAALLQAGCGRAEVHDFKGEWEVTSPRTVMDDSGSSIRMFPGYKALSDWERAEFENAFVAALTKYTGSDGVARVATRAFIAVGHLPVS
ncbi:SAM-dependent methyltransferase [Rhizobium laguerreae]|uniref:SAM-dependent methyltransferase n=1 Tax=Rhizobium laguerreae TaxID=1076926 RepID=A0ABR6GJ08_9HYPH|nr:class I SAM-dependent methyltransferase [Rhizobium laguerreae]MBB3166283.1 SAM-dependent methyltransferase [Rhizobium laguerreae]OOO42851.1 hypothetical protein BS630_30195 [Rhizobium laguerreae]